MPNYFEQVSMFLSFLCFYDKTVLKTVHKEEDNDCWREKSKRLEEVNKGSRKHK